MRQIVVAVTIDAYSTVLNLPEQPGDPIAFPAYFTLRLGKRTGKSGRMVATAYGADRTVLAAGSRDFAIVDGARGSLGIELVPPHDSDGGTGDGGANSFVSWRYASFADSTHVGRSDLWRDGTRSVSMAPPFSISPYQQSPAGIHRFELHPADSPNIAASASVDLLPDRRWTIFGATPGSCTGNTWTLAALSTPTANASPSSAEIHLVHVGCMPSNVDFIVDGTTTHANVSFGTVKRQVVLSGASHTLSVVNGPTRLVDASLPVAAGEIWLALFYYDAGYHLELRREVP